MPQHSKFPLTIFIVAALLCIVYIFASLLAPAAPVSVKLGLAQVNTAKIILVIALAVPIFASLFFGLWSFVLLRAIATEEEKEEAKKGFRLLAAGMLVLTLTLVTGLSLSQIRSYVPIGSALVMVKVLTILINYIYAFGYLAGFYILYRSTYKLGSGYITRWNMLAGCITAILIWTFYVVILFTNPDRYVSTVRGAVASQYLTDPLIFFTIALPALASWFFAITAAFNLAGTYGATEELHRRHGFRQIFYGELIIIASYVMLEAIFSVGSRRFLNLGLIAILIVLYLFVFLLLLGYGFMAFGSKKLSRR